MARSVQKGEAPYLSPLSPCWRQQCVPELLAVWQYLLCWPLYRGYHIVVWPAAPLLLPDNALHSMRKTLRLSPVPAGLRTSPAAIPCTLTSALMRYGLMRQTYSLQLMLACSRPC